MRISLCQAGDMQESSVSQDCSRFCAEEDVIANQGVSLHASSQSGPIFR